MRNPIIFYLLILIIFASGCVQENELTNSNFETKNEGLSDSSDITKEISEDQNTEKELPYNLGITYFNYTKDGINYEFHLNTNLQPALDWIIEDIPKDARFLNWWDYGHMIRGYANKESVIYSPSEDIIWTISSEKWDTKTGGEFSSKEKIEDVAQALSTTDPEITKAVMEKYNSDYLFVSSSDSDKSYVIFTIAGLNISEYLVNYKPKEKALGTVLFKAINRERISGFELVYEDADASIYQLIS
ncbi:MAG: hypothetical protein KAT28_00185 [Candidatus Aenigmarchaeota archaeon]|nr:hypothetical protein [Candidatus Aenigmarchaeota archaeon]